MKLKERRKEKKNLAFVFNMFSLVNPFTNDLQNETKGAKLNHD